MIVGVAVSWEDRDAYYISLVADVYIGNFAFVWKNIFGFGIVYFH